MAHNASALYAGIFRLDADTYALAAREADDDALIAVVTFPENFPKNLESFPRGEWINVLDLPVEHLLSLHQARLTGRAVASVERS